jgi:hypothetical protein
LSGAAAISASAFWIGSALLQVPIL